MQELPLQLVDDVWAKADTFYDMNLWARAFLSESKKLKVEYDSGALTQDDRTKMMLAGMRYDSFNEKYGMTHKFGPKQLVYAVWMMLSFNKKELKSAMDETRILLARAQKE